MNFFKSVFADDEPASPKSKSNHDNDSDSASDSELDPDPKSPSQSNPDHESAPVATSGWDFGGLIKTLATKSESVIDTYKRDLQEFSSGLKAETAVFREVANRAVKELPKAGVSTFDELKTTVLKGTEQIISQGKEALLLIEEEIGSPAARSGGDGDGRSLGFNRFDARLRAIQIDKESYCVEPEDLEDYEKWKKGFVLEEKGEELGNLFEENAAMENIYHKIVPTEIDAETFWYRYFYKVHKLKQAEEVRASFLKKAIDDEEEELSWDVDEEEEESDAGGSSKVGEPLATMSENEKKLDNSEISSVVEGKKDSESVAGDGGGSSKFGEPALTMSENEKKLDNSETSGVDAEFSKGGNKVDDYGVKQEFQNVNSRKVEETADKASDVMETYKEKVMDTVVREENKPAQQLEKEVKGKIDDSASKAEPGTTTDENLGWDEIEDEGSDGEKPAAPRKSQDTELQKRLSSAVEDEDLSWDIEDDDEPVKP